MKNETAVEWLEKELIKKIVRSNNKDIIVILTKNKMLMELFHIAKAIEKEQILEAITKADNGIDAEQYYNEKFKRDINE